MNLSLCVTDIRCLKPNNSLVPDLFDASLIADQLRCAGVIEAVRVSRLGYPQRYSHSSFITRYRVLGMKALSKKKMADRKYNPAKALVHTISKQMAKNGDMITDDVGIQVGKTKIFLRRDSYDFLEKLRSDKVASSAISIQSFARKIVYMRRYRWSCSCIMTIQCFVRQIQAKSIVEEKRRQHNSVIIQRAWRRYVASNTLQSAKLIAIWMQTHFRGNNGRRKYKALNQERRALQIQTQYRSYMAIKCFRRTIDSVLVIQCARRSYLSRQLLGLKKAAARDLSAVVQERDRLRIEVNALKIELQKANETQPRAVSEDVKAEIMKKDNEVESLRLDIKRLLADKNNAEIELSEAKKQRDVALRKVDELELLNAGLQELIVASQSTDDDLERLKTQNANLKSLNEALKQGQKVGGDLLNAPSTSDGAHPSSVPLTPVSAEIGCALEQALSRIASLEAENLALKSKQANLLSEKYDGNDFAPISAVQKGTTIPSLPVTSVYTTATTDNMTADTDDEVAKLREENQVLQAQLALLRDTQILPDIVGSDHDQEYEESVNPSEGESHSEEGDESSGFARYVACLLYVQLYEYYFCCLTAFPS